MAQREGTSEAAAGTRRLRAWARRWAPSSWEHHLYGQAEADPALDFDGAVLPEDAGLDPRRAVRSTPSSHRHLRALLDAVPVRATDAILDVGCGKGSAMRVMLDYPFARVDGVELGASIAETARRNFARLEVPYTRCQVHTADAADFDALDGYTHAYLYNPFSIEVLRGFLSQLDASLQRAPRVFHLLYANARFEHAMLEHPRFSLVRTARWSWGQRARVYRAG